MFSMKPNFHKFQKLFFDEYTRIDGLIGLGVNVSNY